MKTDTYIEINLSRLKSNIEKLQLVSPKKALMAVIKANAYGHGDVEAAVCFESMGIKHFGVARIDEAVRLRDRGIKSDILVFGGAEDSEFKALLDYGITPQIYSIDMAEKLNDFLAKNSARMDVHIKIDTGMNRLGVQFQERESLYKVLPKLKNLKVDGLMSHMLAAGNMESKWNNVQVERFCQVMEEWKKHFKVLPKWVHMENTSALAHFNLPFTNMARPGIGIYGYGMEGLEPVLKLISCVKDIKTVRTGETIGYGGIYTAQKDIRIAVIPVGYGDGFIRHYRKGSVMINGKTAPIVGAVCMDYFMVDINDIEGVDYGSVATIMGDEISAKNWAAWADIIVYEVFTNLNPRIRRIFNDRRSNKA
jgi:alanine racemase